MKNRTLILLLFLFFFSCQKTELQFSCDPEINAHVSQNLKSLSLLTYTDLAKYELPLQRAIFNSWDAEKKRNAWLDKLYLVLENEPFTEAEARHIQELFDHIHSGYFLEEAIKEEKECRSLFAADWMEYASEKLKWPEQYVAYIVYRLYTSYSEMEAELSMLHDLQENVTINSETGSCDCSTSSDFCSYYLGCNSAECSSTTSGCGWLFNNPCNGLCY